MRAAGEAARRKKLPTTLSQHEILLGMHLKELGYGDYQREFRFFPERKWRFDYAVPRRKLAIEIEGGIWGTVDRFGDASSERGRHLRAAGYQADLDKYNAATALGWRVFRFSTQDVMNGRDMACLSACIVRKRHRKPQERADG